MPYEGRGPPAGRQLKHRVPRPRGRGGGHAVAARPRHQRRNLPEHTAAAVASKPSSAEYTAPSTAATDPAPTTAAPTRKATVTPGSGGPPAGAGHGPARSAS